MNISDFQLLSASATELVLPLAQALEAVELLERTGIAVLGWEGWLRHSDGKLGHSARHQGTVMHQSVVTPPEFAWLRETMEIAQAEHLSSPEAPNSQLLFCITPDV
jgi:hypothetical protein